MSTHKITPLILTYNEEANIARTLEKLEWASQLVVIDSGSTDRTLEILEGNSKVRIMHREFDSFAGQCNFGLEQIETEWVLSLDADYILTDELVQELERWQENEGVNGYRAKFKYCIGGRRLRGSLYPPRTVLYRRSTANYQNEGHGHRVRIEGVVEDLSAEILHDDRKPLSRWLDSQRTYAETEAAHLYEVNASELSFQDSLRRRIWPSVPAVFLYTLFWKRCLLDGWPGWYYALQRTHAELLLSLELLELRLHDK